jgi:hypothetical protein
MYDVVIEKTPDGEARVLFAVLHEIFEGKVEGLVKSLKEDQPENEYSIATAEAIALGNLGEQP